MHSHLCHKPILFAEQASRYCQFVNAGASHYGRLKEGI